ncbi:hypothetical protein [Aquimarina rhabdastrellae]
MKQYVKFWEIDEDSEEVEEYIYRPVISGEIELENISEEINILKIYFRKISVLNEPLELFEDSLEIMLSNYPIKINKLNELDNFRIEIKKGWTDSQLFTMLSVRDGEPINNLTIDFTLNEDKSIHIKWTGTYPDYQSSEDIGKFELDIIAFEKENIITPICSNKEKLLEVLNK